MTMFGMSFCFLFYFLETNVLLFLATGSLQEKSNPIFYNPCFIFFLFDIQHCVTFDTYIFKSFCQTLHKEGTERRLCVEFHTAKKKRILNKSS